MTQSYWKLVLISLGRIGHRLSLRLRPAALRQSLFAVLGLVTRLPGIRHILAWRVRRRMRMRPGHFEITRRKSLIRRISWRQMADGGNVAFAIAVLAIVTGSMMAEEEPVGSNPARIAQQAEENRTDAPPMPEDKGMRLSGHVALLLQVAMLEDALTRLEEIESYTTKFEKQERIDGELSDRQVLATKIRHEPFSVYFKYEEGAVGQEVLFPISEKDRRMLVKSARLGGRLPTMKLDPHSPLVMSESRYPITMAGIRELTRMTLEIRQQDVRKPQGSVRIDLRDDVRFDGRPVYAYTIDYSNAKVSQVYRRCILYIDKQLKLPVFVRNWTWSNQADGATSGEFDDSTLIEYYAFRKINTSARLQRIDFARENGEYNLK
jgi:hypothetical protein